MNLVSYGLKLIFKEEVIPFKLYQPLKKSKIFLINFMRLASSGHPALIIWLTNRTTWHWVLAQASPVGNMGPRWQDLVFQRKPTIECLCAIFQIFLCRQLMYFFFNTNRDQIESADWLWPPFCNLYSNGLGLMFWSRKPKTAYSLTFSFSEKKAYYYSYCLVGI